MQHKDNDVSEGQQYLNGKFVEQARMAFRVRSEMCKEVWGNFKDKYRRTEEKRLFYVKDSLLHSPYRNPDAVPCLPKMAKIQRGAGAGRIEDINMVIYF